MRFGLVVSIGEFKSKSLNVQKYNNRPVIKCMKTILFTIMIY